VTSIAEQSDDVNVISQEELDSLFQSLEAARQSAGEDEPAEVTLYDFRRGSKLSPDQMRDINKGLENLTRVLRRTLGVYLNAAVWLELQALSQGTGSQYLSNMPDHPIAILFELLPHTPKAVCQMDASLAYAAMHAMLGGQMDGCEVYAGRELSVIEAALLQRFWREILDTWALTQPALEGTSPKIIEVVSNLAQLDVELRNEQMVLALIEGNIGGNEGRIWMGLPAGALQMLLREESEGNKGSRPISAPLLREAGRSRVELRVVLGHCTMWLSEFRGLREGAQIQLDQHVDDPVSIYLAGRKKFVGRTGVRRGRIAVEITQVVS